MGWGWSRAVIGLGVTSEAMRWHPRNARTERRAEEPRAWAGTPGSSGVFKGWAEGVTETQKSLNQERAEPAELREG